MSPKSFDLNKFYDKNSLLIGLLVIALIVISSFVLAQNNPTAAAIQWPEIGPPIIINMAPVAAANASPVSGDAPLDVYFWGNDSYDTDGYIVSYSWDFGETFARDSLVRATLGMDAWHTYSNAGTYTATLTVTDDDGATDTDSVVITVTTAQNQPPVVDATHSPTNPTTADTVIFNATASDSDGLVEISIYIDSVRVHTCAVSGTTATCVYSTSLSEGTYQYHAGAKDTLGLSGSMPAKTVTVSLLNCTDTDGGRNYDVKGTVIDASGNYTDYCYTSDIVLEYFCNGSNVMQDFHTCSGTCSNGACVAAPTCTDTDGGLNYNIKGTVTTHNDTNTDYCYNATRLREYYCDGNNLASVWYDCPFTCSSGACPLAPNMPPYPSFIYSNPYPEIGENVQFNDTSTDDGVIVEWLWTFGDGGETSAMQNSVHAYSAVGVYTVSLTVTDDGGLYDTAFTAIVVPGCNLSYFIMTDMLNDDVSAECQACGHTGDYYLDIYGNPVSFSVVGPNKPPARNLCTQIVPRWFLGNEWHRKFCTPDGLWYWVEYPANLTTV